MESIAIDVGFFGRWRGDLFSIQEVENIPALPFCFFRPPEVSPLTPNEIGRNVLYDCRQLNSGAWFWTVNILGQVIRARKLIRPGSKRIVTHPFFFLI